MTKIYGDLTPDDDLMHPLGPEPTFNESMYFNFFDRDSGHGGFLRIGNRANERYAEVTACVYLPSGEVLFNYLRPAIESNDAFDAGGMRFDTVTPMSSHRTRYQGPAVRLSDPSAMADPRRAFVESPRARLSIDLTHDAAGPVYGSAGTDREATDLGAEFARGHYEQHMQVAGTLQIDAQPVTVRAFGLRDHSWGPRSWQALSYYRWLNCTFGPDLGIMVSEICHGDGRLVPSGVVIRDGELERIRSVDISTEFAPGTSYQRALHATLGLDGGDSLTLEGRITSFIPLRNRLAGKVTHIGEGMTEYRCAGRVGTGISEYLDQAV
jgi:hypothetical protein